MQDCKNIQETKDETITLFVHMKLYYIKKIYENIYWFFISLKLSLIIIYLVNETVSQSVSCPFKRSQKINIMEWTALVLFFFDFLRGERGGEMWGMIFCVQMVQVGYSHPASSHPDLSHSSHCLASSSWMKGKKGGTTR